MVMHDAVNIGDLGSNPRSGVGWSSSPVMDIENTVSFKTILR